MKHQCVCLTKNVLKDSSTSSKEKDIEYFLNQGLHRDHPHLSL